MRASALQQPLATSPHVTLHAKLTPIFSHKTWQLANLVATGAAEEPQIEDSGAGACKWNTESDTTTGSLFEPMTGNANVIYFNYSNRLQLQCSSSLRLLISAVLTELCYWHL
jgi:hypothetical protein